MAKFRTLDGAEKEVVVDESKSSYRFYITAQTDYKPLSKLSPTIEINTRNYQKTVWWNGKDYENIYIENYDSISEHNKSLGYEFREQEDKISGLEKCLDSYKIKYNEQREAVDFWYNKYTEYFMRSVWSIIWERVRFTLNHGFKPRRPIS